MSKDLSNMDIVLFALYELGGVSKKVHTEHIAWRAYQVAKDRFSWRLSEFKKRDFPDKTPVRFALEQAKKKECGRLVSGRAGGDVGGAELEGWCLTPQGVNWIKENEKRISKMLNQQTSKSSAQVERVIRRIKADSSYRIFHEKETLDDVSQYMFTDMLACTPDAPRAIIKSKFERMLAIAQEADDTLVVGFLQACKNRFSSLMMDER